MEFNTKIKNIFEIIFFSLALLLLIQKAFSIEDSLNSARQAFLKGDYLKSIKISEEIKGVEAKVFNARVLSIYAHFYQDKEEAQLSYLKAYEIAKEAILEDKKNAESYAEAAHALGRYGQKLGIMSAISLGIANRVKKYLDSSLELDNTNIIANLSKGIWHAEIINKAGKTFSKIVYGARVESARDHFKEAFLSGQNQIGVLYELAYGYSLLGEKTDIIKAKQLTNKLLLMKNLSHLDTLYKNKAKKLLDRLKYNN